MNIEERKLEGRNKVHRNMRTKSQYVVPPYEGIDDEKESYIRRKLVREAFDYMSEDLLFNTHKITYRKYVNSLREVVLEVVIQTYYDEK